MHPCTERKTRSVIDAARAGALEEGKGPVMSVKHHLLALAYVGPCKHHLAVAKSDMRQLHPKPHLSIATVHGFDLGRILTSLTTDEEKEREKD